jgi:long-chain acyl-CoA synthetase
MAIQWLLERMQERRDASAVVWKRQKCSYAELVENVGRWQDELARADISSGSVVTLEGDYSPAVCSALLALIDANAIVVPLTKSVEAHREEFLTIAEVGKVLRFHESDNWQVVDRQITATHPMIAKLREAGAPGLVLFSSGSTGKCKAALHNFHALLKKFKRSRQRMVTLTFLLLDHIGGINTLFYTLSNGGTVVVTTSRDPGEVCSLIEEHKVELLPTSPTFLNLLLLSEAYRHYDLSSLKLITYGTEVMPESTLHRLHKLLPNVRLQQTYGLSELGILRSKSRDSSSLWVKVGGEGFETKVVDGTLWVRAQSASLGYLNAPSPFDAEGWMNTGDLVEVDGDYVRILGRTSEVINVGGNKVFPAEVEGVLLQMDNIRDAVVYGEPNPITGRIVVARVSLFEAEDSAALKKRVFAFCHERLARYKVPVKVELAGDELFSPRFKKMRKPEVSNSANLSD